MKIIATIAAIASAWSMVTSAADFNIRDYGAREDAANNAPAINAAISAASEAKGGRVVVGAGKWTSGTIWMKENVELHIEKGAVIMGSGKREDYNADDAVAENWHSESEEWSGAHLVFANDAENMAITGEGVIDGNGPSFYGECDTIGIFPWYKYGLKLRPLDREWFRPGFMLCFLRCRNVKVEGVTLRNTPCWTAHFRCCDGVKVERVRVEADRTIANSDGISFDCTRNAVLRDSVIMSGDDSVTIRASCKAHAATNVCERVLVENCDISSCCFGVRIGVGSGTISNVVIRNCRVHESANGFGFTPAYGRAAKNVDISNISIEGCMVRESLHPIYAKCYGGDKIKDIKVSDCEFETLSPSQFVGVPESQIEDFTFMRCKRRYLPRLKVCFDIGWNDRVGKRSHEFMQTNEWCRAVKAVECLPRPAEACGVLLLSFDDRNFKGWERALPLFAKYDAHATFFVSGKIDDATLKPLKRIAGAGHTVGLHGLNHLNADEAMAACGERRYFAEEINMQKDAFNNAHMPAMNFAYPNCRGNAETDAAFFANGFTRVRGGVKGATPYDPKGEKQSAHKKLVTNDEVFFPASELGKRRRIDTIIMGEDYHTDIDEILECLKRAAERNEVITITSHDISPDAKGINMKTEWLEKMLSLAAELNMRVLGFDDLPNVRR